MRTNCHSTSLVSFSHVDCPGESPAKIIKMFIHLFLALFIASCSSVKKTETTPVETTRKEVTPKEFSRGELILATELLTKVFDEEMAPLACVPDTEEASLLLRTIRPRMEVVQDDLEAMLDNPKEIDDLIKNCKENCTCHYVDELLREHQVTLTKHQKKLMNAVKTEKEQGRCLSFIQETFCQSELFKTLDAEKSDFSFEE